MKNKKKVMIIIAIIVFILMLIPIKDRLWDGGSVEYRAILYKYTKIHRLSETSSTGYEDGWELKILGVHVAGETNVTVEALSKSEYDITDVENVSASISNISLTGATITIKDNNTTPYTYGEWYKLEKKINGKWYELKTIVKDYGFNSKGYEVDENNELKFVIDWEWLYGELSLGSYRIIKEAHHKYIAIPFDIGKTYEK